MIIFDEPQRAENVLCHVLLQKRFASFWTLMQRDAATNCFVENCLRAMLLLSLLHHF